jgi:mannose-1-phosphate guanylyltransferase
MPVIHAQQLRSTIFIETDTAEKFEECLQHAVNLARAGVMQMTFSLKDDPETRYGVRTTKIRRRKQENRG